MWFCHLQVSPKGAHEAPRGSQDAIWGSFLAVWAVKLGQVRSKKPKTIVQINVADIAEIDKDKTLQPPGAIKKGRAGGGVPPWGRQSAARPVGAEQRVLDRTPKSPNIRAIICLRHLQISKSEFLAPPIIPPGGQRIPPGRPKKTIRPPFFSIKISIIF